MKSKKKLLLMGVGVMGALAMGVGATSTFAWYQATTRGANVAQTDKNETMTVTNPSYSATAVDLPVKVVVTRLGQDGTGTGSDALELTHYFEQDALENELGTNGVAIGEHAAGFYQAYYVDSTHIVFKTSMAASHVLYASYKIELKVEDFSTHTSADTSKPSAGTADYWKDHENTMSGGVDTIYYVDKTGYVWSQSEAVTELAKKTVKWSLSGQSGSRAMFWGESTSTAVSTMATSAGADHIDASASTTTAANALSSMTQSTAVTIGYFGLYVDGQKNGANFNDSSSDVSGNFIVRVVDAA